MPRALNTLLLTAFLIASEAEGMCPSREISPAWNDLKQWSGSRNHLADHRAIGLPRTLQSKLQPCIATLLPHDACSVTGNRMLSWLTSALSPLTCAVCTMPVLRTTAASPRANAL